MTYNYNQYIMDIY